MMNKKMLIVLLTIITLNCTTTNLYITSDDFDVVESSKLRRKGKYNKKEVVVELLEELTGYGLILSDNISLASRNNLSSLNLLDSAEDSLQKANDILKASWGITNKEEFISNLNNLYINGLKNKYIKVLELLSTKEELLSDTTQLVDLKYWESELSNEEISEYDLLDIQFLIENHEFISFSDIIIFDLIQISSLIKLGYSNDYLSLETSKMLLQDIALELSKYDYTMVRYSK